MGLESVSRDSKTPDAQSNLPINRPKLNGNVDHRCGNKDVGEGSRSEPGEEDFKAPSTNIRMTTTVC